MRASRAISRNASGRIGFTLVEVMISIAILSMVIAAIYGTWRAIIGATKAGQTTAAEVQRTRVALRCLEQSLTYAQMYTANYRYYGFTAENGSDAYLSFVADLPSDFPRSGRFGAFTVRRVEFSLRSGSDGGHELILRQAPLLMDFDKDEQEHPLVLMKNIKRMDIEFWDMQKMDWTDEWLWTNQIPKLVQIVISTGNPKNPFGTGEEHVRVVSPAAAAVQPGWQAGGMVGAPPAAANSVVNDPNAPNLRQQPGIRQPFQPR
jgi:prepilin-type N-terminal cleavage/methylation domain-containing protein